MLEHEGEFDPNTSRSEAKLDHAWKAPLAESTTNLIGNVQTRQTDLVHQPLLAGS